MNLSLFFVIVAMLAVGHSLPNAGFHRSHLARFEASNKAQKNCALKICTKECVERANKGGACYPEECHCADKDTKVVEEEKPKADPSRTSYSVKQPGVTYGCVGPLCVLSCKISGHTTGQCVSLTECRCY